MDDKDCKTKRKFVEKDFVIKSLAKSVQSLVIRLDTEIITKKDYEDLPTRDGNVTASYDKDVWKVAAMIGSSEAVNSLLDSWKTFGADIGAFGSTQSFHENDMIVIGSNEKDMAFVANKLTDYREE